MMTDEDVVTALLAHLKTATSATTEVLALALLSPTSS